MSVAIIKTSTETCVFQIAHNHASLGPVMSYFLCLLYISSLGGINEVAMCVCIKLNLTAQLGPVVPYAMHTCIGPP